MGKLIDNVQIGQKIRAFRLQAGLTQEKLAEEVGITFQQVQKYERGITKVNLVKLQQLAEVLKVPISSFFNDESYTAFQLTENEILLLSGFRKIRSTEHRDSVIDIVNGLSKVKP